MISEARCDTRPPPTPTFTFRVFFNFHLKNKVIYMSGSRRRRCSAHVSRSDAIGDAPAIAHKARGRSALWCAKCAHLRGPFVHCLPRARGWHCDTFILGHFLWRPLYWKLDIAQSSRNTILSEPLNRSILRFLRCAPIVSPVSTDICKYDRYLRTSKRAYVIIKIKQVSFPFLCELL